MACCAASSGAPPPQAALALLARLHEHVVPRLQRMRVRLRVGPPPLHRWTAEQHTQWSGSAVGHPRRSCRRKQGLPWQAGGTVRKRHLLHQQMQVQVAAAAPPAATGIRCSSRQQQQRPVIHSRQAAGGGSTHLEVLAAHQAGVHVMPAQSDGAALFEVEVQVLRRRRGGRSVSCLPAAAAIRT